MRPKRRPNRNRENHLPAAGRITNASLESADLLGVSSRGFSFFYYPILLSGEAFASSGDFLCLALGVFWRRARNGGFPYIIDSLENGAGSMRAGGGLVLVGEWVAVVVAEGVGFYQPASK